VTELEKLKWVAKRLKIPEDDYLLGGSASMVLHGIDRQLGDVDVFTTTKQWFSLMHGFVFSTHPGTWHGFRHFQHDLILPDNENHRRFDPPILRYNMGDLNLKVDVFHSWKVRDHKTTTDLVHIWDNHRVIVNGLPTTSLGWLRAWKQAAGREKDLEDIKLIDEYLDNTEEVTYYGP